MKKEKTLSKKGMNMLAKITLLLLIPLTILTTMAVLAAKAVATDVAHTFIERNLRSGVYGMEQFLNGLNEEAYIVKGNELLKGDVCLTDHEFWEEYTKTIDLEATVFYGDVRMATSIKDEKGNLILGTKASPEITKRVLSGEKDFEPSVMIEGVEYFGYYEPLTNPDGTIVGMLFTGVKTEIAKQSYYVTLRNNVVFLIIICLIAVMSGIWFAVIIAKGLTRVVTHLDMVAAGNLDISVDEKLMKRPDEIGNVARAIEKAIMSFTTIVKYIIKASSSVQGLSNDFNKRFEFITEGVGNVNDAVTGIADGASSQANETQNVNAKVNDMGFAIDETRDFADKLNESSDKMQEYNHQVQITIEELTDINTKTKNSAHAVYEQTHNTNRSAEQIRMAIEVITDIAGQTNLLSLNASIEAARAGEHGRGFAVVAEEIRLLADQSKESADKITQVITQLIENSNASVTTIDEMLEIMEKQNEKLKMTSDTFVQLNEEISSVNVGVTNISDKVIFLNSLKNEVLSSTENLAAIAEENAASTEETAATMLELNQNIDQCKADANELTEVANQLLESVSQVKVSDSIS